MDSFLPEGITQLAVDSIFMMPQLGVLSTVHAKAAVEVFEKDCLIYLGTCIAPVGAQKKDKPILKYSILIDNNDVNGQILSGELKRIEAEDGEYEAEFIPGQNLDIGRGKNEPIKCKVRGGAAGIFLDGRGRNPFIIPNNKSDRINKLNEWSLESSEYFEIN